MISCNLCPKKPNLISWDRTKKGVRKHFSQRFQALLFSKSRSSLSTEKRLHWIHLFFWRNCFDSSQNSDFKILKKKLFAEKFLLVNQQKFSQLKLPWKKWKKENNWWSKKFWWFRCQEWIKTLGFFEGSLGFTKYFESWKFNNWNEFQQNFTRC